ncbi:protein obstructor-E-like [Musca vetustissima]|uniref:protein obstructor-E-like n=1 Tax=Musca vetustissima TaxID=27455 RepID=UPI002AB5F793|nr:protein obstructor-E-like [Musca vetustissima]
MMKNLIFLVLATVCGLLCLVAGESFDECEGVDPGTYVASSQSCSAFIYCDGEDSILDECEDGLYFDGEECDDKDNVECPLDNANGGDGEEENGDGEDEEPEEAPEEEVIQPSKTTPAPATVVATIAPTTPVYNPAEILDVPPIVMDTCPPSDDPNQIVLISNSNSCSDYYVCYHGNAIAMHCMDHLHFNVATGKCDFPENAKCKVTPTEFNKCLPHMSEFFPHPTKCNYFYYCIKGYQTLQQCPFYYGWDVEKRTCIRMSQAKCYNSSS